MLVVLGTFSPTLGSESRLPMKEVVLAEPLLVTVTIILKFMVLHRVRHVIQAISLAATLVGQLQDVLKLDTPVKIGASRDELITLIILLLV
jgi:hypothetical protein